MNKQEFMQVLKKELEQNNVADIDEILSDFAEHFEYKLEEGKTEEDVVRKIGNPVDIAKDYSLQAKSNKSDKNPVAIIGLIFLDLFTFPIFLSMWLSTLVLGVFGVALIALGIMMILTLNIYEIIPSMPYITSLLLGISMLGLSISTFIGTFYTFRYVGQWQKAYGRWHKNLLHKNIYPSLSMHPKFSKRLSSTLKLANMLGIVSFVATFTIGYIVSAILANSFEFWHVWEWFI